MTEKGYIQATVLEDSVFYNESVECLVTTKASSQKNSQKRFIDMIIFAICAVNK